MTGQRDGYALQKAAILVTGDVTLAAYFQSILAYFTGTAKPNETLLTLKLKELIVTILLGGKNPELAGYFQSLLKSDAPVLSQIMEANFSYNLAPPGVSLRNARARCQICLKRPAEMREVFEAAIQGDLRDVERGIFSSTAE